MKTTTEKMIKINKMLGDNYYLYKKSDTEDWILFRNEYDAFLYHNQPSYGILSSESNTIDELYEFARKHKIYNVFNVYTVISIISIICSLLTILLVIFLHNTTVHVFALGCVLICFIMVVIMQHITCHNLDVDYLRLREFGRFIDNINKYVLNELSELGYLYEEDDTDILLTNGTFSVRIDKNKHKIVLIESDENSMCQMSEELLRLIYLICCVKW